MITIVTTNIPSSVHGIISRYLYQTSKGVYVGNLDAKTRDELLHFLSQNNMGTCLCFFTTNNVQGYSVEAFGFKEPKIFEYEGLTFIQSSQEQVARVNKSGWSKNSYYRKKR